MIVDFFDRLYSSIITSNKILEKIKFYSFCRLSIRILANIIIPQYFLLTKNNKSNTIRNSKNKSRRIVVSLTTFPNRINNVWIVIETILRQSMKPDLIILWLSKEQFQSHVSLPKKLLSQQDRGLQIRIVDGNIKSHKKYYYTLKEFPNDYMLTIDDDIYYRSIMIEDLYNYSTKYPRSIIAQYGYKIKWDGEKLQPYSSWSIINYETFPNTYTFFGSGGGTLFPPDSLAYEVLNHSLFTSLTPTADDVWLNAMCRLKQTRIVKTKYFSYHLPIIFFNNLTLHSLNNGLNKNDEQINNLIDYYLKAHNINPFCKYR
jgi:hypothetical protein